MDIKGYKVYTRHKSGGARIHGWIKNNNTGEKHLFQFNPTDLLYSRGATYEEIVAPGMAYPKSQFVHGNTRSFNLEIFMYDVPYEGQIIEYENFLNSFLPPEFNTKRFKKPPELTVSFSYFCKKCVLENLEVHRERFDSENHVIQATFSLTLRQVAP